MAEQLITLTHPKVEKPYQAHPSQVEPLMRSGWVREGENPGLSVPRTEPGPPKLDSAPARKRAAEAEKENS